MLLLWWNVREMSIGNHLQRGIVCLQVEADSVVVLTVRWFKRPFVNLE